MQSSLASGTLIKDSISIPIDIHAYTPYTLQIKVKDSNSFILFEVSDALILNIHEDSFALGPCRFIPFSKSNRQEGCIIFIEEQYDLEDLLKNKKVSLHETSFFSLPLIISQKDGVSDSFKKYSSDLTFELMVYKQFFDQIDWKISKEPKLVQKQLQDNVLKKEGREFLAFFDSKIELLQEEIKNLTKAQREVQGFFFRKQLWDFIRESNFMTRTNVKPRGYSGDYRMMHMIYQNKYTGKTIFSKLFHKYPLETKAAEAVRNRIQIVAEKISKLANNSNNFEIMSVACGPALELQKILKSSEDFARYNFTLLDQDHEALSAAKDNLNLLENKFKKKTNVTYLNESVRTLLRSQNMLEGKGKYDFIYSMGLFDYLAPPAARAIFIKLFSMLKPGGTLLIGNFHHLCPDREFLEYWLDWVLYYRNEEEMQELADLVPAAKQNIFLEPSGCQMFLEISSALERV